MCIYGLVLWLFRQDLHRPGLRATQYKAPGAREPGAQHQEEPGRLLVQQDGRCWDRRRPQAHEGTTLVLLLNWHFYLIAWVSAYSCSAFEGSSIIFKRHGLCKNILISLLLLDTLIIPHNTENEVSFIKQIFFSILVGMKVKALARELHADKLWWMIGQTHSNQVTILPPGDGSPLPVWRSWSRGCPVGSTAGQLCGCWLRLESTGRSWSILLEDAKDNHISALYNMIHEQ